MFLSVFVCLSICLLARLLKYACMDLDEMLPVDRRRDMDELLIPIRIIVQMPEPHCFLRYRISAATRNFTSKKFKSHVYVLARPAAAARRGFTMVLFTHPSTHLCRRYVRSTECPSPITISLIADLRPEGRIANEMHVK